MYKLFEVARPQRTPRLCMRGPCLADIPVDAPFTITRDPVPGHSANGPTAQATLPNHATATLQPVTLVRHGEVLGGGLPCPLATPPDPVRTALKETHIDTQKAKLLPNGVPQNCKVYKEKAIYKIGDTTLRISQDAAPNAILTGPCKDRRCKCCSLWNARFDIIQTAYNSKIVSCKLDRIATCQTKCLIYALSCPVCGILYVGETKQPLATRIGQHRRNIEKGLEDSHLVNHFHKEHGNIVIPQVRILETTPEPNQTNTIITEKQANKISDTIRKAAETKWILALNTAFPWGLNTNVAGFGAFKADTDPASSRKCPYFTMPFERAIPRGY